MTSKGIWLVLLVCVSAALGQPASPVAIRAAVAKPLRVLLSTGTDWFQKQQCSSCHHQALPLMAMGLARQRGVPVREELVRRFADKSFQYLASVDANVQSTNLVDPAIADSYFLVAAQELGMPANLPFATLLRLTASRQRADGHWDTFDTRPPASTSTVTATAVTVRAMQAYLRPRAPQETEQRIAKAAAWLRAVTPRNTEEQTFQLLGLHWSGAAKESLTSLATALLAGQRPDGGWTQLPHLPSDAYSTGEALFALHVAAGIDTQSPAYQRGVRFLLDSQLPDGTWLVPTRLREPAQLSPPYFETGFPHGHDQFSSCNGTTWATMALLLTLPQTATKPAPLMLSAFSAPTPRWVGTALFGSATDLRRMLDRGLNVNSKTTGGVTLLMLAANDLEKVKLLLERGADANAKSKARFNALLVAATHGGTTEVVRLLLERKAEIEAPLGQRPVNKASPGFLAAWSGDADKVELLAKHGANLRRRMMLAGIVDVSPLEMAVSSRDDETIRTLARNGVDINEPNALSITALSFAAMSGESEQVKLLIDLGANVNGSDKFGMTPLLWASLIDHGDGRLIETLLKAGADVKARTKQGESALTLAKKWQQPAVTRIFKQAGVDE